MVERHMCQLTGKPVANSWLGLDNCWLGVVAFDLIAEPANMGTQDLHLGRVIRTPDLLQYLGRSKDFATIADQ